MFTRNTRRRSTASNTTPTAAAESLETRSLLSATASLANGTLTITGTEGDDRVTVLQYGNDQIRVLLGNGREWGPQSTAGIRSIVANMGGGNDALTIRPTRTQLDQVRVNMGTGGSEYVQVEANYVRSVQIEGRQTQLEASIWNSIGTLRAEFGNGSDALQLNRAAVDQIFAEMGGGNDTVSLANQSTVRNGRVNLGDGDDQLRIASNSRISADLFGGSGRDSFTGYRKDNAGARMFSFEDQRWL